MAPSRLGAGKIVTDNTPWSRNHPLGHLKNSFTVLYISYIQFS